MTPDTLVMIYELSIIVVVGLAFFWVIWDCARKNFKEIITIMVESEELDIEFKANIIKYIEMNGYDSIVLRDILSRQEKNREKIEKHKL